MHNQYQWRVNMRMHLQSLQYAQHIPTHNISQRKLLT